MSIVVGQWESNFGTAEPCSSCPANTGITCEVIAGGETVTVCEAWLEHVGSNEIKLTWFPRKQRK